MILSTLKQAKWDKGLIARFQEIAGVDQTVAVSFPHKKVTRAWLTDLLEHEIGELAVEADGTVRIDVPAWGLTTIRIVFKRLGEQAGRGGKQA